MISVGATVVGVGRTIRGSWLGEVASVDPNGISRCGLNGSWSGLIRGLNGENRRRHNDSTWWMMMLMMLMMVVSEVDGGCPEGD